MEGRSDRRIYGGEFELTKALSDFDADVAPKVEHFHQVFMVRPHFRQELVHTPGAAAVISPQQEQRD